MAVWDKDEIKIPVIRRISTGEKVKTNSGMTRGKKLTHFMATVYNPEKGEYVKDTGFFKQFGPNPVSIPIELRHDRIEDMLTVELIMFTNKSAPPFCISYDGESAVRNGVKIKCDHMNCDYYKAGKCKANIRFYFALQEEKVSFGNVFGETVFVSSSIENYTNIKSVLERLAETTQRYSKFGMPRLAGMQLELKGFYRQKKYMGPDGKTHSTSVMLVYLEIPDVSNYLEYEERIRKFVETRERGMVVAPTEAPKIVHDIQAEDAFNRGIVEEFYGVDSEGNVSIEASNAPIPQTEDMIPEPPDTPESVAWDTETVPPPPPGIKESPLPPSPEAVIEPPEVEEPPVPPKKNKAPGKPTLAGVRKSIAESMTIDDLEKAFYKLTNYKTLTPRFVSGAKKYISTLKQNPDAITEKDIEKLKARFIKVLEAEE